MNFLPTPTSSHEPQANLPAAFLFRYRQNMIPTVMFIDEALLTKPAALTSNPYVQFRRLIARNWDTADEAGIRKQRPMLV